MADSEYIKELKRRRDNIRKLTRVIAELRKSGFMEAMARKIDNDIVLLLRGEK